MPTDAEQIALIKSQTLAQIADLTANPKPTYSLDEILSGTFLLAVIASGGTVLQLTQGLPYAVVNVLMAIILFIVLARPTGRR